MILDRRVDIRHVESDRQPARKCIEVAQIYFPLTRHFQLPLEAIGKLTYGDRNENEQDQVDDFLRVLDAEAVCRRIKEIGRGEDPANGRDKRRHDAPTRRRDHDRDQVNDGTVRKPDLPHKKEQYRRQCRDQGEGEGYARQLFSDVSR